MVEFADYLVMRCEVAHDALSAIVDGEDPGVDEGLVRRHVGACLACREYQAAVDALRRRTLALPVDEAPDLSRRITRAIGHGRGSDEHNRRASFIRREIRAGLVVTALVELGLVLPVLLSAHAYDRADHAHHESVSFAVAVALALLCAAAWPRFARAYLPVVGAAVALLLGTALVDIHSGRAAFVDELPHVVLLLGWLLLFFEAFPPGTRGALVASRATQPPPHRTARLRLIRRQLRVAVGGSAGRVATGLGVVLAAVVVVNVALIQPAAAHATLEGSNPSPDSTLAKQPARVTLRFDEPVTALPGGLRVFAPDGSRVDSGDPAHPGGEGARLSVGLEPSTQHGTYLVSWRVVSADSHPISGAYTFSVGSASAAPTVNPTGGDTDVSVLLGATRWLGYFGSALVLGGIAFVGWCWPQGRRSRRAGVLVLGGVAAVLVGVAGGLLLKGPYDAGLGLGATARPALLAEVLGSRYGEALLARAGLVIALALLAAAARRQKQQPGSAIAAGVAVTSVAYVLTFALAGHASTSPHPAWTMASDVLHVAAMSLWLGGLAMLLVASKTPRAAELLRFSRLATVCVLVLVGTGTYQSWLHVGSWAALPATSYGRELLVKIGLVALILVAAGFSRARVHRPLVVHAATLETAKPPPDPVGDPRVRRTVLLEAVGAIAVLAATSALVATQPARTAYHPSVQTRLHLGPDMVRLSVLPDGDRRMDLHLTVLDHMGMPVDPPEVTVTASLPDQQIGPLPITLNRTGKSARAGSIVVPTPGDWQLSVTVRTTAIDEYTKVVTVPIS